MAEIKDYPPYLDHPKQYRLPTNADYIRAMNNEELSKIITCPMNISNFQCPISIAITCKECKQQWLHRPVDMRKEENG